MNTVTSIKPLLPVHSDVTSSTSDTPQSLPDPAAYGRDLWERSVLFMDTLRERADNMMAQERAGMPPLLDFKYEPLLDARQFDRPANYALLRITEVDANCWDDCVAETKPPVIVAEGHLN